MRKIRILIIRAALSVLFSYAACYIFFRTTSPSRVLGLALFMLGLAYIIEYVRNRDKEDEPKGYGGQPKLKGKEVIGDL